MKSYKRYVIPILCILIIGLSASNIWTYVILQNSIKNDPQNEVTNDNVVVLGAEIKGEAFLGEWPPRASCYGSGNGQFNCPSGIAVDSSGNVFVADTGNQRIQKLDSTGKFSAAWGGFNYPFHIAVDSSNIYVSESYQMVYKRLTSGQITEFGIGTWADGIALDSAGNIYIADTCYEKIFKLNSNGQTLAVWGVYGSYGDGRFSSPEDVAVDSNGNIFVADAGHNHVMKLNSNGETISEWGGLNYPCGIAVDKDGNVYVADTDNHRIIKYDNNGQVIFTFGSYGNGPGQFSNPRDIAVDKNGNIYVVDTNNHRIQKFSYS